MAPTIEVSVETYKALQALAIPFEDSKPEDVIRRLIDRELKAKPEGNFHQSEAGGLVSSGAVIPNGLKLRFSYKGKELRAEVRDSRIWIGDASYLSPSSAAVAAAARLGFPGRSINGWFYWEYEQDGSWKRLRDLRRSDGVRVRRKRAWWRQPEEKV